MVSLSLPKRVNSYEIISGIYLHIPFCRRRCYYCDFPIKIVGESKPTQLHASQQYTSYLLNEIAKTAKLFHNFPSDSIGKSKKKEIKIETIYFGGGTPSLLDDESVEKILISLKKHFPTVSTPEITFEMDPGTFTFPRIQTLQNLGINRISLGIQSFNENFLKICGRAHTVKDIYQAVEDLQRANFLNYNVDLICSLPHLETNSWLDTLNKAIAVQPKHISIYDLQIEEKTAFGRWYTPGVFPLPTDEQARDFYSLGVNTLSDAGFEHYEISNYAKPGYRSEHNQKYWKCLSTFGFGMGAASYLGGVRYTRPQKLEDYYKWTETIENNTSVLEKVCGLEPVEESATTIAEHPDVLDVIMLSLRTADGLDLNSIRQRYDSSIVDRILKAVEVHIENGQVIYQTEAQFLRLKDPEGFIISNDIISTIFSVLS